MPPKRTERFCKCGCGNRLKELYTKGHFKGYSGSYAPDCPNKELIKKSKNPAKGICGENHPKYLPVGTEIVVDRRGKKYTRIKIGHRRNDWVYKHRWIIEQHTGKKLTSKENVHHIDGNTFNNSIENLMVVNTAEHNKIHFSIDRWSIRYTSCITCGTTTQTHAAKGVCSRCYQRQKAKERGYWL